MRTLVTVVVLLFALNASSAQDHIPTAWDLIAHYPLSEDANDVTGNTNPMLLTNAPFVDGSLFLNGIYIGDPGGCEARTEQLDAINLRSVAASLEFKTDSVRLGAVLGISSSFRIATVWTLADSLFGFSTNVGSIRETSLAITPGQWQGATIVILNDSMRLYVDGVLGATLATPEDLGPDKDIRFDNSSSGFTFLGTVRNLKIYSGVLTSTANNSDELPDAEFSVSVFPNPVTTSSSIIIDAENPGSARISIHDVLGRQVRPVGTVTVNRGSTKIGDITADLPPGLYLLRAELDGAVATRRLIVARRN